MRERGGEIKERKRKEMERKGGERKAGERKGGERKEGAYRDIQVPTKLVRACGRLVTGGAAGRIRER